VQHVESVLIHVILAVLAKLAGEFLDLVAAFQRTEFGAVQLLAAFERLLLILSTFESALLVLDPVEPTVLVLGPVEPAILVLGTVEPTVLVLGPVEPALLVLGPVEPAILVLGTVEPTVLVLGPVEPTVLVLSALQLIEPPDLVVITTKFQLVQQRQFVLILAFKPEFQRVVLFQFCLKLQRHRPHQLERLLLRAGDQLWHRLHV
jgi:hypothetical protein